MLHEFDEDTQEAIRAALPEDLLAQADSGAFHARPRAPVAGTGRPSPTPSGQPARAGTATLPRQGGDG